ncbi:MAG: carbohydrate ABC transporter permease, partial [Acidimicrobiales bacterium]
MQPTLPTLEAADAGATSTGVGAEASPSGLSRRWATGFVSPAVFLIGVFLVFPALWTLYLGITDYRLTGLHAAHPRIVGLSNYRQAVTNPTFGSSLLTTALYV